VADAGQYTVKRGCVQKLAVLAKFDRARAVVKELADLGGPNFVENREWCAA